MPENPLHRYAIESPAILMKRIAALAIVAGYSQTTLAAAFGRHTHQNTAPINVMRHFQSKVPQRETVAAYAALLGVSEDDLALLAGRPLTPSQISAWEKRIQRDLRSKLAYLSAETPAAVAAALSRLGSVGKTRAVREYAYAQIHEDVQPATPETVRSRVEDRSRVLPWHFSLGLCALTAALKPELDLAAMVKPMIEGERVLADVYHDLLKSRVFAHDQIEAILSLVKAFLGTKNVNMAEAERHLKGAVDASARATKIGASRKGTKP